MSTFTWLSGDIGNPNSWLSAGSSGHQPGPTDSVIFGHGGVVSGTASVGPASFAGAMVFSAVNLTAGGETVSSGASITQSSGANSLTSSTSLVIAGGYTLSGGTVSGANAAESVTGTFRQVGGSNIINEAQVNGGGSYTLSSGTFSVVSGKLGSGDEYVGLTTPGGFVQSGGTHTVAHALQIGYGASGTYTLTSGTLSMPISTLSGNGEYIGENNGGVGVFIQTGGTNTVADRIVIGTYNVGSTTNASGTYTLGGTGAVIVNTLFVGSENGASGTFNFNSASGDTATLTISGTNPSFPGLIVGGDGTGKFVQGGGTVDTSLQIGRHYDGVGTYLLSSGTLKTESGKDETIGAAGSGTLDQSAGSNSVGGNLYIGSGSETPIAGGQTYYGHGLYKLDGQSTLNVAQHVVLGVSAHTVGELEVDSGGGAGAVVTVSASDNNVALTVGSNGSGTFEEDNGSVTLFGSSSSTAVLDVGAGSTGSGSVKVKGGTLTVTRGGTAGAVGRVVVGDKGDGSYQQSGGQVSFGGDLFVGLSSGGQGSFSLGGAASTSLVVSGGITIAENDGSDGTFDYNVSAGDAATLKLGTSSILTVGGAGEGDFNQGGGTITVAGLEVGADASLLGGSGTFTLSSGTLNVSGDQAIIGDGGVGIFVHNGGSTTANFSSGLDLGAQAGASGSYELSAGNLNVSGGLTVGDAGSGDFTQSSGSSVISGGLVVGASAGGEGSVTVSGGTVSVADQSFIGQNGSGSWTQSGGSATFDGSVWVGYGNNASGKVTLGGNANDTFSASIYLGVGAGATGEFDYNAAPGDSATLSSTAAGEPVFNVGVGGSGTLVVGGGTLKTAKVQIGSLDGSKGAVTVSGAGTVLSATNMNVGTYQQGTGTGGLAVLKITDGATVDVASNLLNFADDAQFDANGQLLPTSGMIVISSGGGLDIGGDRQGLSDILQVEAGAILTGHGLIDSEVTGTIAVGNNGHANTYSLTITNSGTVDAIGGALIIHGSVIGDGTLEIDGSATLELGGSVGQDQTVTFSGSGGTLVLDDPLHFEGKITGLEAGDKIIFKNTSVSNGNGLYAASLGDFKDTETLFVAEGYKNRLGKHFLHIPINGAPGFDPLTGNTTLPAYYFKVTAVDNQNDTALTLTKGNPIDDAVNGPAARDPNHTGQNQYDGRGITIGVISLTKNNGAEAQAMAQIIHAIAPGARVEIVLVDDSGASPGEAQTRLADAINALREDCQIIVDDVNSLRETDYIDGGLNNVINVAVDAAVQAGDSYFVTAGNTRPANTPISGHRTNPNAITVAAANWLVTPVTSGYLPPLTEGFSSTSNNGPKEPDITAPDGGPSSASLSDVGALGGLNPFFGTSAAAPAAAAVAALMLQANLQLQTNPALLKELLRQSAVLLNDGAAEMGKGLIQADAAVQAAIAAKVAFQDPPSLPVPTLLNSAISRPSGSVSTGTQVQFQLTFNQPLIVSGTPTLTLNDGGIATYDAVASQPSNGSLVFDYRVALGQTTPDLEVTGFVSSSGNIANSGGLVPDLSGMFNQPTGLSINTPVAVTSVTSDKAGQEVTSGSTAHISMTLNHSVSVTSGGNGGLTLALGDGGTALFDSALSTSNTLVFDYVVSAGRHAPDLTVFAVNLASGTTVQSGGFNADMTAAVGAALGVQVGAAFVAGVFPSQTGDVESGTSETLTIEFSQAVSVNTAGGSPTLTLNNGGTALYDAAHSSAGSGVLVFDYSVSAGQSTPNLEITAVHSGGAVMTDSSGVALDFSAALNRPIGVSTDSPLKIISVTAPQAVFADTGQTVQLAVSMSEAVSGGEALGPNEQPTLTLNDGGTAFFDVDASNLATGVLVFDYTVSATEFTPDLKVVAFNGISVTDAGGNTVDLTTGFPFDVGIGVNAFDRWAAGKLGNWSSAADWSLGVPTSKSQVVVLSGGVVSSTAADNPSVASIATASGATLDVVGGTFSATSGTGVGANAGSILVGATATLKLGGTFVNSGSIEALGAGARITTSGAVVQNAGGLILASGSGAEVDIQGVVSGGTVKAIGGGELHVFSGGSATSTTVASGGIEIVSSGAIASNTTVLSGGTLIILSGGSAGSTVILAGGTEIINSGGTDLGASISGGTQQVFGKASGATVSAGGTQIVEHGGTASAGVVLAGGTEIVSSGGSASSPAIGSGGTIEIISGGTANPTLAPGAIIQAVPGQVIPLSTLATLLDPNNVSYQVLQLWDSSGTVTGGEFKINGTVQPANVAISVSPANFANTVFVAGTQSGTDQLYTRLEQNGTFTAWVPFSVTVATPMLGVAGVSSATAGQVFNLSNLVTISDPSNVGYQLLQLWDSSGTAAGGEFKINGTVQPANAAINVTAANLANTVFDAGTQSGTDTLYARLEQNNGTFTAWQTFTVSVPTPTLAVASIASATQGQVISLSNLVSISDPGNVGYQLLQLWDSSGTAAGGEFKINGTVQPANAAINVTAANFASTVFDAGTLSGTDTLYARLEQDNGTFTAWQTFTVSVQTPTLAVSGIANATRGQVVNLSNLVSISDPGNVGYQLLQLWDSSGTAAGGEFKINGTVQPANAAINVTAANFANTVFDVGTLGGSDTLYARLEQNNGTFTAWQTFTVTAPVAALPTLSVTSLPVAASGQVINLSNLVSIADPGGVNFQKLELWDSNGTVAGGQFKINGTAQTGGHEIDVTPADVANVVFDAGTLAGTDTLWAQLQLNDGTLSGWKQFAVTIPGPTLAVGSLINGSSGQVVNLSTLVAIADPGGVSFQKLELWDSNGTVTGGQFKINNVAQTGGHEIDVAPANVANTVFDIGTSAGTDTLWAQLQLNDGSLSGWKQFSVSVPNPTHSVSSIASATKGQIINLSSLVTIIDAGNVGYQKLELWDSSGTVAGGRFVVNSVAQTGGHEIDVTPANVAATVFDAGTSAGSDTMWAQLQFNDGSLSGWKQFSVTVPSPTLNVSNVASATKGQVINLSSLVTIIDAGNVGYQKLELWDSNGTVGGGQFVVNSVAQTGNHQIDVTPANVAGTVFDAGTSAGSDTMWAQLQFNDGSLSGWKQFSVTVPNPTLTVHDFANATPSQVINLSSLLTIADPGNVGYQKLELWDSNGTATTGQFIVNGAPQTGGHEIDVSPANVANTVFKEGSTGATDTMWAQLQLNDGTVTGWQKFTVTDPLEVEAGATLELSSPYAGTINFLGATGTLQLDDAADFTGTVAGLTGADVINLRDMSFAGQPAFTQTSTGGTLSMSDGIDIASIQLAGDFTGAIFTASSDGHGGTSIVKSPYQAVHG